MLSLWIVFSLLTLLAWGVWGLFIKIASKDLSWLETYFLSSLTSFLLATTVFLYHGRGIRFSSRAVYTALLAGLFSGSGYIFFVKALESGKASIVIPLTALYPAITVVLALLVLGEKLSIYHIIGILMAIGAVILLSMK